MENSLSNINSNSNSWKIALAIAIPIAIVPKKAIAIAVSILLLMSARKIMIQKKWQSTMSKLQFVLELPITVGYKNSINST